MHNSHNILDELYFISFGYKGISCLSIYFNSQIGSNEYENAFTMYGT